MPTPPRESSLGRALTRPPGLERQGALSPRTTRRDEAEDAFCGVAGALVVYKLEKPYEKDFVLSHEDIAAEAAIKPMDRALSSRWMEKKKYYVNAPLILGATSLSNCAYPVPRTPSPVGITASPYPMSSPRQRGFLT